MLCQCDKLSQRREELVGGTHPKKINQKIVAEESLWAGPTLKNKPKKMADGPLATVRHYILSARVL